MLKDDIRTELRISHTKLDSKIENKIDVAKAELKRLGIKEELLTATDPETKLDPLIEEAITTYCKFSFAYEPAFRDGFWNSWIYQTDNLRKTAFYAKEATNV